MSCRSCPELVEGVRRCKPFIFVIPRGSSPEESAVSFIATTFSAACERRAPPIADTPFMNKLRDRDVIEGRFGPLGSGAQSLVIREGLILSAIAGTNRRGVRR